MRADLRRSADRVRTLFLCRTSRRCGAKGKKWIRSLLAAGLIRQESTFQADAVSPQERRPDASAQSRREVDGEAVRVADTPN